MSSTTKVNPQAKVSGFVQIFGLACVLGGLLWWLLNISELIRLPLGPPIVAGLIGVVLVVGLAGGPLGLLTLQAAGSGRMGRVGATVTLIGLLSYLTGQLLQTALGLAATDIGIFYAKGALFVSLGILPLGIAVLLARRLAGWKRFAPLFVGAYYVAMIPVQIVFFIGPNGAPSNTLLAFWGLTWVLLGYTIFSESKRKEAKPPRSRGESNGR